MEVVRKWWLCKYIEPVIDIDKQCRLMVKPVGKNDCG